MNPSEMFFSDIYISTVCSTVLCYNAYGKESLAISVFRRW